MSMHEPSSLAETLVMFQKSGLPVLYLSSRLLDLEGRTVGSYVIVCNLLQQEGG